MNKVFNYDGPIFTIMGRFADLVWLNVLWIICSIPIFTIGASTTALYYVTMKMVKDEDCYITKSFFKSFKLNFKQATGIWLIFMLIGGILAVDYGVVSGTFIKIEGMSENFRSFMVIFLVAFTIILLFVFKYVFPVLAKFDNTVKNTIRNALLISIRHLPFTLLLFVISAVPIVLAYFFPIMIMAYLLLVFSLEAFVSSYIYVKIFANYITPAEVEGDGTEIDDAGIEETVNEEAEIIQTEREEINS